MSSTQEKLEEMLRVMYVTAIQDADGTRAGRKDYRLRYDEVPEAYAREIMQLIDSAKREGFLEGQLESLGKVTKENFMYRCLYGELLLDYKGVDLLEAYKSYRENDSFRENFARYVEWVAVELEQSEESK